MIIETYSVAQPHREGILIWITASALVGSAFIIYRFGLKGLPAVLAFVILAPISIVAMSDWLAYERSVGGILALDVIFPLCLLALPPALLGIVLAIGVRRLVGIRSPKGS